MLFVDNESVSVVSHKGTLYIIEILTIYISKVKSSLGPSSKVKIYCNCQLII